MNILLFLLNKFIFLIKKLLYTSSSNVSIMSIDEMTMSSKLDLIIELQSSKILGMSQDQTGMLVSIFMMQSQESKKVLIRQTLRKKLFGPSWVLVN